jgi:hypothetical protein
MLPWLAGLRPATDRPHTGNRPTPAALRDCQRVWTSVEAVNEAAATCEAVPPGYAAGLASAAESAYTECRQADRV